MNPEQWLSLKWNGGSTMSDRWLNQSKIIHLPESADKAGLSVWILLLSSNNLLWISDRAFSRY